MKFLVDAQLPPALVDWLRQRGHEADHVDGIGLLGATDGAIWDHAIAAAYVLVTKDRDFSEWSATRRPAPTVLWLRFGNARKSQLFERLAEAWPSILSGLDAAANVVEVH